MALRVPVNPNTSPSGGTLAPVSGGNIPDQSGFAQGLESAGAILAGTARRKKEDQIQQDDFDLTNKFIQQNNEWQQDFAARQTDPNMAPGAAGFAQGINADFTAKRDKLIAEAQAAGADIHAVRSFAHNLGMAQNRFLGEAVGFEQQQAKVHAGAQLNDLNDNLSVHVLNNPNDVTTALNVWDQQTAAMPNLTPGERETLKQAGRDKIFLPGAQAFAKANPQITIDALDPSGALSKPQAGVAPTGGKSSNQWGQVAVDVANHFGLKPEEVGAVMHLESGFDPNVKNAQGYLGLIQLSPAAQRKYGITQGSTPAQWTDATIKFLSDSGFKSGMGLNDLYSTILTGGPGHYDRKDSNGTSVNTAMAALQGRHMEAAKGWIGDLQGPVDTNTPPITQGYVSTAPPTMTQVDPDTGKPIDPYSAYPQVQNPDTSQWDKRADGTAKGMGWLGLRQRPDGNVSSEISVGVEINGKEQDIPLMVPGLSKSEMDYLMTHNPDQEQNPNFIKDMPQSILQKAEAFAKGRIDKGESPFRQPGEPSALDASTPASMVAKTTGAQDKTGIPIFDVLNGQQRLQMLAEAQNEKNRKDANLKAEAAIQHENTISAYSTAGSYAGPRATEQDYVNAGYLPAQAHQMVGQENAMAAAGPLINGMATMNVADMQARVQRLKPTDTASNTYEADQQVYQAATVAMQRNIELRKTDPGAYVLQAFPSIAEQMASAKTVGDQKTALTAQLNAFKQLGYAPDQWVPVSKAQAEQMANAYASAAPAQRMQTLDNWFHSMPQEMVRPFITALVGANSKAGPSIGRDSFLYATLTGHPEFSAVMKDAMAGAEAAAADSSRRLSSEATDKAWRNSISGNSFNSAAPTLNALASGNYKDVAADLYVNAGGKIPQSSTDTVDQTLWDDSVRRAVGGLKGNPDTGLQFLQGKSRPPTILPPTVTKQEFEHWTDTLHGSTMNQISVGGSGAYNKFGKPVLIKDIQDYGAFIMRAPGSYAIQFPDGGTLLNNQHGEYIIHISPNTVRGR